MYEPRHILVPVDFSACSRWALQHAAALARRFDASVDVLHVLEPPVYGVEHLVVVQPQQISLDAFVGGDHGKTMRGYLEILEQSGISARGRLEVGPPWRTIVNVARVGSYDLVVMGTHGRTGLAHVLLGGVAEKVVRHAPCAVLTVRAEAEASAHPAKDEQPDETGTD